MTNTGTAPRPCRYTVGQAVEVLHPDFTRPGYPDTWFPGIVETVELRDPARGLWDVKVRRGDRSWSPQIVGPRGGNKHIRPAR